MTPITVNILRRFRILGTVPTFQSNFCFLSCGSRGILAKAIQSSDCGRQMKHK